MMIIIEGFTKPQNRFLQSKKSYLHHRFKLGVEVKVSGITSSLTSIFCQQLVEVKNAHTFSAACKLDPTQMCVKSKKCAFWYQKVKKKSHKNIYESSYEDATFCFGIFLSPTTGLLQKIVCLFFASKFSIEFNKETKHKNFSNVIILLC